MEVILLPIRLFLFVVFAIAGTAKLLDTTGSQRSAEDFGVPESLSKTFSIVLPIVELIAAFGFLFQSYSWYSSILSLLLMIVFIGGMIYQIYQGNTPNCHCFGQLSKEPIGYKSLIRNAIFAILAFILIISGKETQGVSAVSWIENLSNAERMQFVFGLLIVVLLTVAVSYLTKILKQAKEVSHQIEVFEFLSADTSKEVEREEAKKPDIGFPIGSVVSAFSLPNSKGTNVELNDLLTDRKPLLLFFVGANCNPCQQLLPEIDGWQEELGSKVKFVFISSGKPKENIAKFGKERILLLQKDREVAELFEAQWTPTMVFVNADGVLASRPAVGDIAIRELFAKIRKLDFDNKIILVKPIDDSKIGDKLPEFELPNSLAKSTKNTNFIGKKSIAVFWSITCPHCVAFLEEFRNWDVNKTTDEPNLVIFSTGSAENMKELGFRSTSVTDSEWEVSNLIGMEGTPSAILINEDGQFASETAVGAKNILALLGK